MELIKQRFLVGTAVFLLLSYIIPCHAQSPNEMETLEVGTARQENRIKINGYLCAGIFGGEKKIRNYYGEGSLNLDVCIGRNVSAFSEVHFRAYSI